ncbi:MAG: protein translocase subunit SecD [Actinobacteria bacterium]|nr:protein translocase subunit SecD [Actinomycetota bacterium]
MKQQNIHVLVLAVVLALVGVAIYLIYPPGEKTRLGLDLQGGLEVVFQAKTSAGKMPSSDQMQKAIGIMDRRVNGLGVTESQVQRQGTDQIAVALPGVKDAEDALQTIGKTAQLEFYDDSQTRIAGPEASKQKLLDVAAGDLSKEDLELLKKDEYVAAYRVVEAPPGVFGSNTETLYFLYKHEPAMVGDAIDSARQGFDQQGRPNVLIDFTGQGGKKFEEVTRALAIRGALQQQNQSFAIVLDNVMESDPIVDYAENPQGISGGKAEITGTFTLQEAKNLALVLNTGALPVTLEPIQKQQVSATLGKDSLRQALIAGMVGLGLVLIFMVAVYRFLGLIADLALVIYGILLWGVFNAVPVTLTLPGIAGMILTIGVAVDANIVVFERIKEEVRYGKSVRSAVSSGYSRGFRTILDANILILLTALVLFYFATSQPKGFALTLMIGVVVSMFTAILATRAMLGILSRFAFFNRGGLMGVRLGDGVLEALGEEEQGSAAASRRGRRPAARNARPAADTAIAGDGKGAAEEAAAGRTKAAAETPPRRPQQQRASAARRGSTKKRKKRR